MATAPNDAWRTIKPLDQLAGHLAAEPPVEPAGARGSDGLSLYVKGLEAIFVADIGDEYVEAKFRYRPRAGEWQLFRRHGSRWVADGPPMPRIGRLLEKIVLVMQGGDPLAIFAEES